MKCNQKCQWNVNHECMKFAWVECPLSKIKLPVGTDPRVTMAVKKGKKPKPKDRVNPNRKPVSKATVKKLQEFIKSDSINLAMALFLTTLCDKFGYDSEQLHAVWDAVNDLSKGVALGYVNINDLIRTLDEEYGIHITI